MSNKMFTLITILIASALCACSEADKNETKTDIPLVFKYPSISGVTVAKTGDSKTYILDSDSKLVEAVNSKVPSGSEIKGAFISNIFSKVGRQSEFDLPNPQTASAAEPATGRYVCMISSGVVARPAEVSVKLQSIPTVVRVPISGIPAGEQLVSVELTSSSDAFVNAFSSECQSVGGKTGYSVLKKGNSVTVLTPNVKGDYAFVDFCLVPEVRLDNLLGGISSDKTGSYGLTVVTSKGGQELKRTYGGIEIADRDFSSNAVVTLQNNGGSFKLSDDFQGDCHVKISSEPRQLLHFGVDCERLWYFWDSQREALCKLAAGDLQVDFARVAINAAYEREEGDKQLSAYTDDIIPLMTLLKKFNPDIKFFASPRPLKEAYSTKTEQDLINETFKNGDITMYAYPIWVGGNKNILIDEFKSLNREKMIRYLSDYLNLMGSYGFQIDYMDLVNEDQSIWNQDIDNILYVVEQLPKHLNAGVKMPLIMFPSTWSPGDGFKKFLNIPSVSEKKAEVLSKIGVVTTHNTPDSDINKFDFETLKAFADAIHEISPEKEIWNSEMHAWVGTRDPASDIRNSEILWKHLIAGFSGIDTWLFFGSWGGAAHPMVYSNSGNGPETTTKYEIFKTVVNEAVQGRFHSSVCSNSEVTSAVMIKGDRLVVCLHNLSEGNVNASVDLPEGKTIKGNIDINLWEESKKDIKPRTDLVRDFDGKSSFKASLPGKSLEILIMTIE